MNTTPVKYSGQGPVIPRRAFVAAALSALAAGGAVTLGMLGGLSSVQSDVFQFSRGTSFVTGEEARLRGLLAEALPDERVHVTIVGHTGDAGDASANLALSEERAARAVSIAQSLGIPGDRITATGVGGDAPLAQANGESDRAFQSRLARVEISLQVRR